MQCIVIGPTKGIDVRSVKPVLLVYSCLYPDTVCHKSSGYSYRKDERMIHRQKLSYHIRESRKHRRPFLVVDTVTTVLYDRRVYHWWKPQIYFMGKQSKEVGTRQNKSAKPTWAAVSNGPALGFFRFFSFDGIFYRKITFGYLSNSNFRVTMPFTRYDVPFDNDDSFWRTQKGCFKVSTFPCNSWVPRIMMGC